MKEITENDMADDIERLCDSEDEVVGYAIVVTRKSGGVSCAARGSTNALVGCLELAKYKMLVDMKEVRDE